MLMTLRFELFLGQRALRLLFDFFFYKLVLTVDACWNHLQFHGCKIAVSGLLINKITFSKLTHVAAMPPLSNVSGQ